MALLEADRPPSIVIVSGSAGRFGIAAAAIEEATGIRTINASTHAALEWDALDLLILSRVRAGDTVLLPLEYEYLAAPRALPLTNIGAEIAHSIGLDFFLSLSLKRKVEYFRRLSINYILGQLFVLANGPGDEPTYGYWAYKSLPNGDLVFAGNPPNLETVLSTSHASRLPASIETQHLVCSSIRGLSARGVRVIGAPPGRFIREDEQAALDAILPKMKAFYEGCGADFVSDPKTGALTINDMLDTLYHPTEEGRRTWTERLVAALCEKIACPGRRVITPLPS